jgi:hypothetical protein
MKSPYILVARKMVNVDDVELLRSEISDYVEPKEGHLEGFANHLGELIDKRLEKGFMWQLGVQVVVILNLDQALRHLLEHILLRIEHRETLTNVNGMVNTSLMAKFSTATVGIDFLF